MCILIQLNNLHAHKVKKAISFISSGGPHLLMIRRNITNLTMFGVVDISVLTLIKFKTPMKMKTFTIHVILSVQCVILTIVLKSVKYD